MIFRRSRTDSQVTEQPRAVDNIHGTPGLPSHSRLSEVPDRDLFAELRRRGWVAIPEGSWEAHVGELEAKLAASQSPEEWMAANDMVDATEIVGELREYAGVHYPAAVEQICDLHVEVRELRTRVAAAEREAWRLAAVIVGEELPETNYLTNDD